MSANELSRLPALRRTPLAACLAAVLLAVAPAAPANTVPVTNCADSGAGSLRAAVAAAGAGDTVDMTGLTCSSITLTTGEITIAQSSLTLRGPGASRLQIDANHNSRVLHGGSGTSLSIYDLSIVNGYIYYHASNALGGCIFSATNFISSVHLKDSNVSGCSAQTYSGMAKGGGIYANNIYMTGSTLASNSAGCYSAGSATGGGATTITNFVASYSTISNNTVACRPGGTARAGAVYSGSTVFIDHSTISKNASTGDIGGIGAHGGGLDPRIILGESTISGNVASGFIGGMSAIGFLDTVIDNSTIAFNSAGAGSPSSGVYQAPGLHIDGGMLSINSSLIANNTYGPAAKENDLSSTVSVTQGANNLIRVTTASAPNDTISACPLLGPLRNNGGATLTHALLSHSPGIDAGNNAGATMYDQRGPPFLRVDHGAADIGAYEVQQEDIVFNSGFDGCP